jgi:hypothetical protein
MYAVCCCMAIGFTGEPPGMPAPAHLRLCASNRKRIRAFDARAVGWCLEAGTSALYQPGGAGDHARSPAAGTGK